jgi:hypothetical protein
LGNFFEKHTKLLMLLLECSSYFQRFALAAVELNGAIYATGGYDGKYYLK